MKIEQLNENITAEQLQTLIDESDININEYLRIQKFFDELKIVVSKDMQSKYVEYLYKLSTNQYIHTVNMVMGHLSEFTTSDVYNSLFDIVERIATDIDKGITYTNGFIDNMIVCSLEEDASFVKLFDIYTEALEDEMLKDKIIELLSNHQFVINRMGRIRDFIKELKNIATLENQSSNNQTSKNLDALFQIIISEGLLISRVTEEHLEVVKYFVYNFDVDQSYKMLKLYTDSNIVNSRYGDAHLFILDLYNKLVLHNENSNELVARLFTDKNIYRKLSFDFQIYLIEILQEINDPSFLKELESILTLNVKNLPLAIKEIIKEYTNYAKTVKQIINSSCGGKSVVDIIASEAQEEKITEITSDTKLVLVPNHDITGTVNNLKKVISQK